MKLEKETTRTDFIFAGRLPFRPNSPPKIIDKILRTTQRDIYLSGVFYAQDLLHETLHMFTGGEDIDLAKRLGVDISDGNTSKISDALKNGGCGE